MHLFFQTLSARATRAIRLSGVRAAFAIAISVGAMVGFITPAGPAWAAPSPSAKPSASAKAGQSAKPGAAGTAAAKKPAAVTWGIGPAAAVGAAERPFFSFGVTPGAQASDHVTLVNYSLTALDLDVYSIQADNTDTGAIGFLSSTDKPADIASWLSVGVTRPVVVQVPGRPNASSPPGHVTLPIKLVVPLNAEPGDHVGGIAAALDVESSNSKGEHLKLEQRVVSRVYVRVSGPLRPKLEIVDVHARYHEKGATFAAGSMSVSYTIRNTGNVRVKAVQAVQVSGLFGSSKKVDPGDIAQLLPGGSSKVSVVIPGVWPTFLVRPRITVTTSAIAGDLDPHLPPLSSSSWVWAIPWGVLAIVLALGLGLWLRRRYRRRAQLRRASTAGTPDVADATTGRHRVGFALDKGQPMLSRSENLKETVMKLRIGQRAFFLGLLGLGVCTAGLGATPAFAAPAIPYVDHNAVGTIGLCGQNGQPLTHGSIDAKPFIWKAVDSTAAAAPYNVSGSSAILYAYQPRQGVDPREWSGSQLSGGSRYTTPAHPTAVMTGLDDSLSAFLLDFHPQWNGLIQLRIYLKAANEPVYNLTYDATNIKITGNTWSVVGGSSVSCGLGSSVSVEQILATNQAAVASLAAQSTQNAFSTASSSAKTATATTGASGKAASVNGATPSASSAVTSPNASNQLTLAAASSKKSSFDIVLWILIGVAAIGSGFVGAQWLRSRG